MWTYSSAPTTSCGNHAGYGLYGLLRAMDSMARSLISKSESYYLDLFLFCFYYGGMAPIDTA